MSDFADLDLRLVRYFTVVAEHRHFGRAATALHITQPSLSRQVRRLERELGVELLDRTPQGTRLTEAGEVFLPRARALLRAALQAATETRAAAEPSRITVGYTTGVLVTPAVRELRRRFPDADVRATHLRWHEARDALLGHRVDALVARLPFATDGLRVTVLYDEPRVVVVPLEHRLAGKESVTLDDIADEPLPASRTRCGTRSGGSTRAPTGGRRRTGPSSGTSRTSSNWSPRARRWRSRRPRRGCRRGPT